MNLERKILNGSLPYNEHIIIIIIKQTLPPYYELILLFFKTNRNNFVNRSGIVT